MHPSTSRFVPEEPRSIRSVDRDYVLRPWSSGNGPVPIVEAKGSTVVDEDGKQFCDFTSGYFVNNAGHCHPRVAAAAAEQLQKVCQVAGKQTTRPLVELARRIVDAAPRSLTRVLFTTGGSESTEFAMKMARQHTGKTDIAALEDAYHGLSLGALAACANQGYRATSGVPLGDNAYHVANAYCYRCPHRNQCALQCVDQAEEAIEARPQTAALLAEPIQAVGGLAPPKRWWKAMDAMRRRHGLLLILDEVQTGLGRAGTLFAAERYGLEPDIITMAKGLSGGVGSLGAVLVSDEIAETFIGGTTPTSAGNAVSAAAGAAMFDVLVEERLVDASERMGRYLAESLHGLDDPWIGDVRVTGLMGGAELVLDRETREPLPKAMVAAVDTELYNAGFLVTFTGRHKNMIRLQPPLVVTAAENDGLVAALSSALRRVRSRVGEHRMAAK